MYRIKHVVEADGDGITQVTQPMAHSLAVAVLKDYQQGEIVPDKEYATCGNCENKKGKVCKITGDRVAASDGCSPKWWIDKHLK